jgi:hypothetical protein
MPVSILVKSSNKRGEFIGKKHGWTISGKINLDKTDSSVLSGMFVNVQFPLKTKTSQSNMILIPESALIRQGSLPEYTPGNGNVHPEMAAYRENFGNK